MPDADRAFDDPHKNRIWRVGVAEFDESRRELRLGGQVRTVEPKPLLLLETLLSRAGDIVTKEELLAIVWQDRTVVEQSLTTAVSKLRTALGDQGRAIVEAVHGVGYRIGLPIELRAAPEPPKLAFTFQSGDPVPNRPQWRLERPLGSNTANDVWLARHQKTGEQRVFKFADTTPRLDALKRETALSRILHDALGDRPDLVRISEWNFESRPFFIESAFGGNSLPEWAAARGGIGAIPLAERVHIVAQIARTVAAAHDVGVLHRDIKPNNVLVTGDGAGLAVRLVDFGSGRLTEAARLGAITISGLGLTAEGAFGSDGFTGTLRYMAPEVVAGGPPTIAADVYALGMILYQMIVGDLDRPLGAGWEADISDPLLREDVREAASTDVAKRLPSALILAERLETLAVRRAERERLEQLQQAANHLARRVERAQTRRPWLILGITSLALGLLATGIFAARATRARNEALREASIARQVNIFLTDDLLGRGNPFRSGSANESLMEAVTKAEPRIADRFAREPIVAASLYAALAQAFSGRSAYAEARAAYDQAVEAYDQAEGKNAADATILRLRQVPMEVVSLQAGSMDRAKQLIQNAEPVIASLGPRSAEANAWLLYAKGMLQLAGGDVQQAQREFVAAADIADTTPGSFDEQARFDFRQREAFADFRLGQFSKADKLLSQLLSQQLKLHGPRHPDTLLVKQTQATVLMASGHSQEAIRAINGMVADLIAVYGLDHRLTLQAYTTRAEAEGMSGRYEDAIRDDLLVYKVSLAKQGSHAFYTFGTLSDMATSECRSGRSDPGLSHALQAFEDAKATVGETNAIAQIASTTVAFCLIINKQYERAANYLDGLNAKNMAEFLADPDNAASTSLLRAAIAVNTGDAVHARELLRLPLIAYNKPYADKFYHDWTLMLSQSVADKIH